MTPAVAACRSCNAPIIWAVTTTGKRMPVDAGPRSDGTFALRGDRTPVAVFQRDPDSDEPVYMSHFATCPNAGQHRKSQ